MTATIIDRSVKQASTPATVGAPAAAPSPYAWVERLQRGADAGHVGAVVGIVGDDVDFALVGVAAARDGGDFRLIAEQTGLGCGFDPRPERVDLGGGRNHAPVTGA